MTQVHLLKLYFPSEQAAISFAMQNGYDYEIGGRTDTDDFVPKSYADNFAYKPPPKDE